VLTVVLTSLALVVFAILLPLVVAVPITLVRLLLTLTMIFVLLLAVLSKRGATPGARRVAVSERKGPATTGDQTDCGEYGSYARADEPSSSGSGFTGESLLLEAIKLERLRRNSVGPQHCFHGLEVGAEWIFIRIVHNP
jgi:hypothetical protein